jgi:hypothetical protein
MRDAMGLSQRVFAKRVVTASLPNQAASHHPKYTVLCRR